MRNRIYSAVLILIIAAFSACRPEYYTPDVTATMTTSVYGNNNTSGSSVYTFGSGSSITLDIAVTPFTTNSTLNITYTSTGGTYSFSGFPKTCTSSSAVNTTYYLTSPTSSTYTLTVTYTSPSGKTVSKSYTVNPAASTTLNTKLFSRYGGSTYTLTFATGSTSNSYYYSDIYLSENSSSTFSGSISTYMSGASLKYISTSSYTSALTQGDMDNLYRTGGTAYTTWYTPSVPSAYVILLGTSNRTNGRNYALIKVTGKADNTGYATDYVTLDWKY